MSFTEINGLTKKNQEFIHIATNQLIKDGKSDSEIKELLEEILPTIIENQKNGITARNLYGAPSEWAASKSTSAKEKNDQVEYNENPWLMWVDSSLLMLAIIAGVNGLMNLFGQGAYDGCRMGHLSKLLSLQSETLYEFVVEIACHWVENLGS